MKRRLNNINKNSQFRITDRVWQGLPIILAVRRLPWEASLGYTARPWPSSISPKRKGCLTTFKNLSGQGSLLFLFFHLNFNAVFQGG